MSLLEDKVAVVYGGGGAIGSAVARAFHAEGARVFLAGHRKASLASVGLKTAELDEVDALDERAVDAHFDSVVKRAGRVDVAFDGVGFPSGEVVGVPLLDLDAERFTQPLLKYARTWFLVARHAARRMVPNGSGVIMTVTALHSRMGLPLVGGYTPAMASKEALTRALSAELGPRGIRVLGLRPQAIPESSTIRAAYEPRKKASGLTWEQWKEMLAARTHPRRLLAAEEVGRMAAFAASEHGSALTGTTLNLTLGSLDD